MRPVSLTLRMSLLFAVVAAAVLLSVGYFLSRAVEAHFEAQDRVMLQGKLELIRHLLAKVRTPADLTTLPQKLGDALVGHHDLTAGIRGPGGSRIVIPDDALHTAVIALATGNGGNSANLRLFAYDGRFFRGMSSDAATGLPGSPPATVALALDITHHLDFMVRFRKSLWLAITLGTLVALALGWAVSRRGLAPIHSMAAVTRSISPDHLGARLATERLPAELTELGLSFNAMLSRLEESFHRLAEFSSDLAHELRTPLSNLTTQTQVALSRSRTPEEYREILASNLEEFDRLSRMVSDMLFLAKADNGLVIPSREAIDLADEVKRLFEFYEALAEEALVRLTQRGDGTIFGDRLMIQRALGNLLSNAIRHTPRGEAITVDIDRAEADRMRIAVSNPGPPVPPEQLERIFDRFYRIDPARRASTDGAGLGLSITRSIALAHGGGITARYEAGRMHFDMLLPTGRADIAEM